jgi:hypothetical protein
VKPDSPGSLTQPDPLESEYRTDLGQRTRYYDANAKTL